MLLFDRNRQTIGLKPARRSIDKNAYPFAPRGHRGGKVVRGFRMCRDFNIDIGDTRYFVAPEIDNDGILRLSIFN